MLITLEEVMIIVLTSDRVLFASHQDLFSVVVVAVALRAEMNDSTFSFGSRHLHGNVIFTSQFLGSEMAGSKYPDPLLNVNI